MIFALSVIIKTTIILSSAALVTLGLRRASAAARHAVWAIALFSALAVPFASFLLPDVAVPVLPAIMADEPVQSELRNPGSEEVPALSPDLQSQSALPSAPVPTTLVPAVEPPRSWSWQQWVFMAWLFGCAVVLGRLILGSIAVWRLSRRAIGVFSADWSEILADLREELSLFKRIRIRISHRMVPPMTWGILRHVILLPDKASEWSYSRRRLVLAHELAHVKRNDGIIQILIQAVCSFYWFNPLVWYAARRLRIERECACDDQVLRLGTDPDEYADHLLQVARTINPGNSLTMATVAMAQRSQLETRLLSILDTRTRRKRVSPVAAISMLSATAVLTLSLASLEMTARPAADSLRADLDAGRNAVTRPGLNQSFEFVPDVVQGAVRELGTATPIHGALLTFTPVTARPGLEADSHFNVETRPDGTFTLPDLPPGQYRVNLLHDGFVRIHSGSEPSLLTIGDGRPADLQLQMMRGPAISGRIFDEDGDLKQSTHVELLRTDIRDGQPAMLPLDLSTLTDSRGEYRLFGLEPGEYYLRARARAGTPEFVPVYYPGVTDSRYAIPITVRAGADISGIDLSLTHDNMHSVRVKVDIASPIPRNPELSFYVTPKNRPGAAPGGAMQFHSAGNNNYVSPLLAPGSYEIEVYLRDPDPIRWARTTVTVETADVDAGTLVIGPGTWIQGRILALETLPVNVRRGELRVVLRPLDGSVFLLPSAQVNADGSFLIPRVPERQFRVDLMGLPSEVYFASARYGGAEVQETGISVSPAPRGQLELFIARAGGVIAGVVRNSKDQPVGNGQVILIPSNRDNPSLFRTASTDQFGVFSIAGIPPGEYGVVALQGPQPRAFLDPIFLQSVESQAIKTNVQRGLTNTVNVRALPGL